MEKWVVDRWILTSGDKSSKNDLENPWGLGIYIGQEQSPKLKSNSKTNLDNINIL